MSRMAAASDGSISEDDKPTRTSQTEAFVSELMHLLRCDNEAVGVQIRETVKELISYELSPAVYPYLFECMMTESGKVTSKIVTTCMYMYVHVCVHGVREVGEIYKDRS